MGVGPGKGQTAERWAWISGQLARHGCVRGKREVQSGAPEKTGSCGVGVNVAFLFACPR